MKIRIRYIEVERVDEKKLKNKKAKSPTFLLRINSVGV
jgi:hypothetical protein